MARGRLSGKQLCYISFIICELSVWKTSPLFAIGSVKILTINILIEYEVNPRFNLSGGH